MLLREEVSRYCPCMGDNLDEVCGALCRIGITQGHLRHTEASRGL